LCIAFAVEIVLTIIFAGSGVKLSFLRILRMLRIARMLRLMKSWKGLYQIVMTVFNAMPQMANVLVLMFLISLIFALLGMQIFGAQVRPRLLFVAQYLSACRLLSCSAPPMNAPP
jgi:hypothetical protein